MLSVPFDGETRWAFVDFVSLYAAPFTVHPFLYTLAVPFPAVELLDVMIDPKMLEILNAGSFQP
jgi:hypothetical protein